MITASEQIEASLFDQARDWNNGDIEGFMKGYWRSPALTFSSGGTVEHGWRPTLERYQRRYPTTEEMGHLTFDGLEIELLDEDVAMVLGEWLLLRADGVVGGNFTLVLRRISGRWKIVHDHTSVRTSDNTE